MTFLRHNPHVFKLVHLADILPQYARDRLRQERNHLSWLTELGQDLLEVLPALIAALANVPAPASIGCLAATIPNRNTGTPARER